VIFAGENNSYIIGVRLYVGMEVIGSKEAN
jgi:hypothetical protein